MFDNEVYLIFFFYIEINILSNLSLELLVRGIFK